METKKIYEGPKMPEKVEKLDVKIVKDFLKNNNIDSENPKIQELIKGVVESSTNTEDSLKNLYAYLSGKSLIIEKTIKYSELKTSKKDENKDIKKSEKKESDKTENKIIKTVSKKGEESKTEINKDGVRTIKGKGYEITNGKLSNEKISAEEKQKEILAYPWKNTDLVEVNGKKYKFEDVKKYLSDGKDGKLTEAFYKKLQELKKGEKVNVTKDLEKTVKGEGYVITTGKLPEKEVKVNSSKIETEVVEKDGVKTMILEGIKITKDEGTIDIIEEDRYYDDGPSENNSNQIGKKSLLETSYIPDLNYNSSSETITTSTGIGIISSDPNQVLNFRNNDLPKKDPNNYVDGNYHIQKDNDGTTMTYKDGGNTAVSSLPKGASGTICINGKCITQ